jgi:hypothetical protein
VPDITITVSGEVAERLAVLVDRARGLSTVEAVVGELIDHAKQGVYRPGSWERPWLQQAFGDEWTSRLIDDERPEMLSADGRVIFDRPRPRP